LRKLTKLLAVDKKIDQYPPPSPPYTLLYLNVKNRVNFELVFLGNNLDDLLSKNILKISMALAFDFTLGVFVEIAVFEF
jgi:hypothetical protein